MIIFLVVICLVIIFSWLFSRGYFLVVVFLVVILPAVYLFPRGVYTTTTTSSLTVSQAQEWYREDAVGRAVNKKKKKKEQTTSLAEPRKPSPPQWQSEAGEEQASGVGDDSSSVGAGTGVGAGGVRLGVEVGVAGVGAGVGGVGVGAGAGGVTSGLAVPREDVFVTTKIHPRDFGAERLRAMVEASDGNLQVRGEREAVSAAVAVAVDGFMSTVDTCVLLCFLRSLPWLVFLFSFSSVLFCSVLPTKLGLVFFFVFLCFCFVLLCFGLV